MAKFSVGQKVVCIDDKDWHETLSNEKIYEVEDVDRPLKLIKLCNIPLFMRSNRFKLYKEKEEIMSNKKVPHVHAEAIKAWADGAEIEFLLISTSKWATTIYPSWSEEYKYRVKPDLTYPETTLTGEVLHGKFHDYEDSVKASHVHVANEVIKHFIVSGDMDNYIESIK
jgi:hypothetical protein